jgi:hypothetical protein
MNTLNATCSRRALVRLTTPAVVLPKVAGPRYRWLRVSLPVPAATDSRDTRATLSTAMVTDWVRAAETAVLLAVSTGVVALLAAACR